MRFLNLDAYTIVARIIIILLILPIHEFAHALIAKKFGDRTAEANGRLTLNPLKHIDPFGAILLLLSGFGWAKPVPVDTRQMKNPKQGIIWTSLAGPLSNLIVAFLGLIVLRAIEMVPVHSISVYNVLHTLDLVLFYFVRINIGLAVFNLIPVPPLDGSKVLMSFLPYKSLIWINRNQQIISIVFMVLILSDVLDVPLSYLSQWCFSGMMFLTNWVDTVMTAIFG